MSKTLFFWSFVEIFCLFLLLLLLLFCFCLENKDFLQTHTYPLVPKSKETKIDLFTLFRGDNHSHPFVDVFKKIFVRPIFNCNKVKM